MVPLSLRSQPSLHFLPTISSCSCFLGLLQKVQEGDHHLPETKVLSPAFWGLGIPNQYPGRAVLLQKASKEGFPLPMSASQSSWPALVYVHNSIVQSLPSTDPSQFFLCSPNLCILWGLHPQSTHPNFIRHAETLFPNKVRITWTKGWGVYRSF